MKKIWNFVKEYWFQLAVILLLIVCHAQLVQINENTEETVDMIDGMDSSIWRMNSTLEEHLPYIESNTDALQYMY